jgi:hypothetical protein
LEDLHPRLPATFFHCFVKAVNRWTRVYDYRDALERVDFIKECCDLDGEQYEFPDVEGCIPAAMRRKPLSENWLKGMQQARRVRTVRRMLRAVLDLSRVALRADRPILTEEVREQLMDCNPPLPGLVAVFTPHDDVEGCFDDEAQAMQECSPEPNLIIPFDATDVASVRLAFSTLSAACETLAAASRLIDLMPGNDRWVVEESGK